MNFSKAALLASPLVAVILTAGCSTDSSSPFQPNVVNETDTFAVQASGLSNVNVTESYTWQNPGVTANVGNSGVLTSGDAALTVMDAIGATVYTGDLSTTGTFNTTGGASGSWTVQLVLVNYSGDLDFSLQTP